MIRSTARLLKSRVRAAARYAIRTGVHPARFQYRILERESLAACCQRYTSEEQASYRRIHSESTATNPLPANCVGRDALPDDPGWWGYSFYDVPRRRSGPTELAQLPNCTIVPHVDANKEFWVTVLNQEGKSLLVREMALRAPHHRVLRTAPRRRLDSCVWVLERVYDNYSHWFTAHLPKIILLREQGLAEEILLPEQRPAFIDDSLRKTGFSPENFRTFSPDTILEVSRLTLLNTDRFRPELLQLVPKAMPSAIAPPHRQIFISREGASRRRLINEGELWPLLEKKGFERVRMETLSFDEQVALMQETKTLCAPHGAGLTNMMFCQPGTQIIEMADLSFPNPNFYAVACAMSHQYWLVSAEGVGDCHPLEKDMRVDPEALEAVLNQSASKPKVAQ
ncbi:glycosyltransferase family 61 protein [Pelagicoccus sp. SDUM812002]|uniref:glycosyltransferase family 61 protein n=1 Tax=Pelagicoccus sp. SDUM812002 TaxID=3041266 RepID=UPI00280F8200|nr:glycosyltransferase family 61 protein [Pelagicoccus sp. SDUM812002]MDQ8184957.1 glycosyltransferase family 61 protein [Pelagicoccus sp. SDUM812002]